MWHAVLVSPKDKPLVILSGEIKKPPLPSRARIEAGCLLRRLQKRGVVDAAIAAHAGDRPTLP